MRQWTEEQKRAQSEKMKQMKPWLHSTGPKTEEGKKRSSQNGLKHGMRSGVVKELRAILRQQAEFLKGL